MKVVLGANFPRDEKLGSSRTPLRLLNELARMGVEATGLFKDDLLPVPNGRLDQLTSPFRMGAALLRRAESADVVDIAGPDGWFYSRLAKIRRRPQALVSRSNGLWYRALAVDGQTQASPLRRIASSVYQEQVLCRWERSSIKSSDIALFLSRSDADEVVRREWKSPDGAAFVNPAVDEFFGSAVPLADRKDVVFVGTFFYRKGSDVAARAMSRILRERPALGFTLIGTGLPRASVLALFDEPVRDQITVIEAVPSSDLARHMERFAVMVFPTRYEGFGIVVVEGMRAGLVVVTTPTGAGVDAVRDGENGLLVPVGDADATYAAVSRLLDDPGLRIRLGAAAAEDAARRTWRRAAADLVLVYERALALARRRLSRSG